VENFSACRIRTLQYEYTIRQIKNQTIIKRLKRAKYLSDHIDQLKDELNQFIQPQVIHLLSSDTLRIQLDLFLSSNQLNSITTEDRKQLFQQLEELSCLDSIIIPEDHLKIDEQFTDDIDE
jgi:hypothetical protein